MTEINPLDSERIITAPSSKLAIAVLTDKLNECITIINAQQKELELLRGHGHLIEYAQAEDGQIIRIGRAVTTEERNQLGSKRSN